MHVEQLVILPAHGRIEWFVSMHAHCAVKCISNVALEATCHVAPIAIFSSTSSNTISLIAYNFVILPTYTV